MGKKRYLEIEEPLRDITPEFFDGPLVSLVADLEGLKRDFPEHSKLTIEYEPGWGDGPGSYCLIGTRNETDQERDRRLAQARKAREKQRQIKLEKEQKEKEELKRLIAKYGPKFI